MRNLFIAVSGAIAMFCQSPSLPAQDVYHGGALDARQHGFEHGYRDGFAFGQNPQVSNRDQDIVNQQLRAADKNYEPAFGSRDLYRQGYEEGFRSGMEDSRAGKRSRLEELFRPENLSYDPDRNRDDRIDAIYPRNHWPATHVANDIGYRDGLYAGMQDRQNGRRPQPRQHTAWQKAVHGYDGHGVPKGRYQLAYREAYELGYRDGFGGAR